MSDVIRSSVASDNLAAIYRANLFALQHHPSIDPNLWEQLLRENLGNRFEEVYLNRRQACLTCHNSDSSTTGPSSGWDRFFPIPGSFEQALYGGVPTGNNIYAVFRTDQQQSQSANGACPQGSLPWGMSGCGCFQAAMTSSSCPGCSSFPCAGCEPYFTGALADGSTITNVADLFQQGYDGLALHGLSRSLPSSVQAACNTCQNSCVGTTPADPLNAPFGAEVKALLTDHNSTAECGFCHGTSGGLTFYNPYDPSFDWTSDLIGVYGGGGVRVVAGDPATSLLVWRLRGWG